MNEQGIYYFHQGTNYYSYELLGSHYTKEATTFRVWAPNAVSVSVVGDFNEWNRNKHPMTLISDGVWEVEISKLERYDIYKYSIESWVW